MEKSNKRLSDLQILSDQELKSVVGGGISSSLAYAPLSSVKGVSLDTKQLKFLARQNLAGVVGVPC